MNSNYKIVAAVIGSFVLGASSGQMLHAQAKPKAYAVAAYHSISDPEKFAAYAKLALPAIAPFGARVLARGNAAVAHDQGLKERTVLVEYPSLEKAIAAYDSPAYAEALKALGDGAKRDFRIVEGVEQSYGAPDTFKQDHSGVPPSFAQCRRYHPNVAVGCSRRLIGFIAPFWTYPNYGNYAGANGPINELVALAEEKDSSYWKAMGMLAQGSLLALTGKAVEAVPMLTSGLTALRSTGSILHLPWFLLSLTRAYSELTNSIAHGAALRSHDDSRYDQGKMARSGGLPNRRRNRP